VAFESRGIEGRIRDSYSTTDEGSKDSAIVHPLVRT